MADSLFSELQRRNVFRVAVAYIVASWIIIEALSLILEIYEAPTWVMQFVFSLLAIGLPITLFFSWAFEITPEGIKRESEVDRSKSIVDVTGKRLDYVTIFMVLVGAGLILADRFVFVHPPTKTETITSEQQTSDSQQLDTSNKVPVVAILPFEAIGSSEDDYFTSGLHEDLLTRLAKLNAFKVISRTSMKEYANTTKNIRQIGKELGADYILEGGVQTLGNRIKITAQLIEASADEHIWAEVYNRELTATDIFEIQADLSFAITHEMKQTLSPKDKEVINRVPTQNLEAYNHYLRGLDLVDRGESAEAYLEAFEKAVTIDPNFAQAWASVSFSYSYLWRDFNKPEYRESALNALAKARAIQLDLYEAEQAWIYFLYYVQREYNQAIEALEALEKRASLNAQALETKAYLYRRVGKFNLAYQTMLSAQQLNPRSISHATGLIELAYMIDDCTSAELHMATASHIAPNAYSVIIRSVQYERECTGDLDQIDRLIDRYGNRSVFIMSDLHQALNRKDYLKVLSLLENAESNVKDIRGHLSVQIFRASAFFSLQDKDALQATLAEMAINLKKLESNPDLLAHEYPYYKAAYHALNSDKEETRYWNNEYLNRLKSELKRDRYLESRNLFSVALFYAIAGLHLEAIEVLRQMFEQPGGYGFIYIEKYEIFEVLKEYPEFIELREKYRHKRCSENC